MESTNTNSNGIGGLHIIVPLVLDKKRDELKQVINQVFGVNGGVKWRKS